jgi:eukaryotic-like serine/threonine-protein kinase
MGRETGEATGADSRDAAIPLPIQPIGLPGRHDVAPARQLYGGLFLLTVGALPVVLLLARDGMLRALGIACGLSLAALFALFFLLSRGDREIPTALSSIGNVVSALVVGAYGYFWGPNTGFAALIALILVLLGVFTGGVRAARFNSWLVYGALALGQGAVVLLVAADVLPDRSLSPLKQPGHPMWHSLLAHGMIQVLYLGSLLAGHLFQHSYARIAAQATAATNVAIRREALLAEAQAEYHRALVAGGHGLFSGGVLGQYRLGDLVGRGGMGEVYEAAHIESGTAAAVKVLRTERLGDRDSIRRFINEVETVARVQSPYVVRIFAAGGLDERLPYIAMELLHGSDLPALLHGSGPLSAQDLRVLIAEIGQGLHAAHCAGVIHRDVSPLNLFRATSAEGGQTCWKLIDFGVAQEARPTRTDSDDPAGTLRYMAPEQLGSTPVDARADLYSFAAVLYLASTGHEPFEERGNRSSLASAVLERMPRRPTTFVDLPGELELALHIGLAKRPEDRYPSAAEMSQLLLAALDGSLPEPWHSRAVELTTCQPWDEPPAVSVALVRPERNEASSPADLPASLAAAAAPAWLFTGADDGETLTAATLSGSIGSLSNERSAVATTRTDPQSTPEQPSGPGGAPGARVDALRDKTLAINLGVLGLVGLSALGMAAIASDRVALYGAYACMVALSIIALARARWVQRAGARPTLLIWLVMFPLGAGPAYFFGMNSGFAVVLVVLLFAHGAFAGTDSVQNSLRASWPLPATVFVVYSGITALILVGILPDAGFVALRGGGSRTWEAAVEHLLIQGIYLTGFLSGHFVDNRVTEAVAKADAAAREAARKEALLDAARAELRRALTSTRDGIFSDQQIGEYRLGRLLGRGGMGEVYEARHIDTGTRAAVKLIRGDRLGDRKSVQRFVREATALSRVDSPQVARILGVGGMEGDLPHIAMEFLDGETLAALLRDRERLDPDELRRMIVDIGYGLQAVHDAGIVHRDMKPHNIMYNHDQSATAWKLVDFGVAKLLDSSVETTLQGRVGTPQYMAPEQAQGRMLDARADLYSFCLVIYRALVGRPAFSSKAYADAVKALTEGAPPAPVLPGGLSGDVAYALRLGLARRPEERFASAQELADAFAAAFAGRLPAHLRERARELLRREPWAPPETR